MAGERLQLNPHERRQAIAYLPRWRYSIRDIAHRLHVSARTTSPEGEGIAARDVAAAGTCRSASA